MADPMDIDEGGDTRGAPSGASPFANPFAIVPTIVASSQNEAERLRQAGNDDSDPTFIPNQQMTRKSKKKRNRISKANAVGQKQKQHKVTKPTQPTTHRAMTRSAYRMTGELLQYLDKEEPTPESLASLADALDAKFPGTGPRTGPPPGGQRIYEDEVRYALFRRAPGFTFSENPAPRKERHDAMPTLISHPAVTDLTDKQIAGLMPLLNQHAKDRTKGPLQKIKVLVEDLLSHAELVIRKGQVVVHGRAYQPGDENDPEFWGSIVSQMVPCDPSSPDKEAQPDQATNLGALMVLTEQPPFRGDSVLALVSRFTSARVVYLEKTNGAAVGPGDQARPIQPQSSPNTKQGADGFDDGSDDDKDDDEKAEPLESYEQVHDATTSGKGMRLVRVVDRWMEFVEEQSGKAMDTSIFSALSL